MTKAIKRTPILAFPDIEISDAAAVKAINAGTATPEQQKRGLDWIMKGACMIGGEPFCPGEPDSSAYKMGKQSVARNILFVITEPIAKFDKQPRRAK